MYTDFPGGFSSLFTEKSIILDVFVKGKSQSKQLVIHQHLINCASSEVSLRKF